MTSETVSIQIPADAEPGDVLTFAVEGNELELQVPDGSQPGDVLEIQIRKNDDSNNKTSAAATSDDKEEHASTLIDLPNDRQLKISNDAPKGGGRLDVTSLGGNDGTHAMVWPSALAFVELLPILRKQDSSVPPKRILELGSGTGVMGMAYAATHDSNDDATVVLTDCKAAMQSLADNLERNRQLMPSNVTISAQSLDWDDNDNDENDSSTRIKKKRRKNDDDDDRYDLILGSDLLYNIESTPSLVRTIRRHLSERGRVWWVVRWRKPERERVFFEQVGLQWTPVAVGASSSSLSWQDFGNPSSQASNRYFRQTMLTVGGQGDPRPLADIEESHVQRMNQEEYRLWERAFIQVYVGTRPQHEGQIKMQS